MSEDGLHARTRAPRRGETARLALPCTAGCPLAAAYLVLRDGIWELESLNRHNHRTHIVRARLAAIVALAESRGRGRADGDG